jgi:hypothetical protein
MDHAAIHSNIRLLLGHQQSNTPLHQLLQETLQHCTA